MRHFFRETTKELIWLYSIVVKTRATTEFNNLLFRLSISLIFVCIVVVIEGAILWFIASDDNPNINNLGDGIYSIIVGVFGETIPPNSLGVRILNIVSLVQGLALATYLVALAAFFTIKGGRIMTRKHNDHIVICGWNFQGPRILQELINARSRQHFDIVVVPGETPSNILKQFGNSIFIVEGATTEDETLINADISQARSAIILTDTTLHPNNADAKVLMITLAVETLNRDVYTCAQIMNSENSVHLKRANVDELIMFDVIGANLSVASALSPGVTRMVSELIHFDEGSELYRLEPPVPKDIEGINFKEALKWFSDKNMILIGVESDDLIDSYSATRSSNNNEIPEGLVQRGVSVNPKNYSIKTNDALFVIADDPPKTML